MNTLRQSIKEYLAMRRSLGFKLQEAGQALSITALRTDAGVRLGECRGRRERSFSALGPLLKNRSRHL